MFTPLTIGAFLVALVVLVWALSVLKTTVKTAFTLAIIVFVLQVVTGIGPLEVWEQLKKWLLGLGDWFETWGGRYKPPSDFRENQTPRSWGYNEIAMTIIYLFLWIH
ncbi:MAG: hypothetical protein ACK4QL_11390 [Pseudanabaenaceae cyanobacterium]